MDEKEIKEMSKEGYKKRIKKLVEHAAFNYFIHEKEQH